VPDPYDALSVNYRKIIDTKIDEKTSQKSLQHLRSLHLAFLKTPLAHTMKRSSFMRDAQRRYFPLYPSKEASLYFDLPKKVVSDPNDMRTHLSSSIKGSLSEVEQELIVISLYFIPRPEMMQQFKEIRARDIPITVITNSMASTDVSMVYSGYRKYIKPLLEMGVTLYELKPYLNEVPKSRKEAKKFEHISLHTKMILIDNDQLLVGKVWKKERRNATSEHPKLVRVNVSV